MPARMLLAVSALALVLTAASPAAATECGPGGNASLQACLDGPSPVLLPPGVYTIDPAQPQVQVRNRSGLHIGPADPQNPPLIRCQVDPSDGRPLRAPQGSAMHGNNNGINIYALSASVADVVVENLRFEACESGLFVFGEAGGTFVNLTVRRIHVENALNGGVAVGGIYTGTISRNEVIGADRGLLVWGAAACPAEQSPCVVVADNEVIASSTSALKGPHIGIHLADLNGLATRNAVAGYARNGGGAPGRSFVAQGITGTSYVEIRGNEARDTSSAVNLGSGPGANFSGLIAGNVFRGITRYAITAIHGTHGWTFGPNVFNDPVCDLSPACPLTCTDIYLMGEAPLAVCDFPQPLGPGTWDNHVVLLPGQTLIDESGKNTFEYVEPGKPKAPRRGGR
jgi:hypothetical protein